jgi:cytidylate kinase
MAVITIRGQLGSGAPEIGMVLAKTIGADYVDREVIAKVAERLKVEPQGVIKKEMPPSSIGAKILEAFALSFPASERFSGAYMPIEQIPPDDISYREGLEVVIRDLAKYDPIVIRGRGSQFILKNHPRAFHVLTVALLEIRVQRVMASLELDEEAAKKEINRFDSSRREFTRRYFKADPEDPVYYDLVVNTGRFSISVVPAVILDALHQK